jgi:hypothetical protein
MNISLLDETDHDAVSRGPQKADTSLLSIAGDGPLIGGAAPILRADLLALHQRRLICSTSKRCAHGSRKNLRRPARRHGVSTAGIGGLKILSDLGERDRAGPSHAKIGKYKQKAQCAKNVANHSLQ